jgi:GNAT superfamily N-acetyltransferase
VGLEIARKFTGERNEGKPMNSDLRVLIADDAAAYQKLRLRSLQEHPEAYGSDYSDEVHRPLEAVAERLQDLPDRFTLGAWTAGQLVGIVSFYQGNGKKIRHRGGIAGMYVAPEARGQGVGTALLTALVQRAHQLPSLEEIILAVTVGNGAARSIYLAAGFQPSHVEKRYIKVADRYYDIEWMTLGVDR